MLKMQNGDYVPSGNTLETAEGAEAMLQRVLFRLTARRDAFPFGESLGSRLWQLGAAAPAGRPAAAGQYVAEALAEEDVEVAGVTLSETEGGAALQVSLTYRGEDYTVGLTVR